MWKWVFVSFLIFWLSLYLVVKFGLGFFPTETEIKGCITTRMFKVELCSKSKEYLPIKRVPQHFIKALLVSEDSLFWEHHGFDWNSLEENFKQGFASGKFKRGGSTISQQLAKNMFLTAERSFYRKAKEAIITLQIEKHLSKKEILEKYLNIVEFGPQLYGLKNAAQFYFHKSPQDLNLAESAFLIMLLPNPKKYSQSFRAKQLTPFAHKRVLKIIEHLYQFKMIPEEQYLSGLTEVENLFPQSDSPDSPSPSLDQNQDQITDEEHEDDDLFL